MTCRGYGVDRWTTAVQTPSQGRRRNHEERLRLALPRATSPVLNATISYSVTTVPWPRSQCRADLSQGWLSKPDGASPPASLKTCQQHEQHPNTEPDRDHHHPRAEHPATLTASLPLRDCILSNNPREIPPQAPHKPNQPPPPEPTLPRADDAPAGPPRRYSSSSASQQAQPSAPSSPRRRLYSQAPR